MCTFEKLIYNEAIGREGIYVIKKGKNFMAFSDLEKAYYRVYRDQVCAWEVLKEYSIREELLGTVKLFTRRVEQL